MPEFTDTLQYVNPDGSMGAVFPGGVKIPAPVVDHYGDGSRSISWVKDVVTGASVATIEVRRVATNEAYMRQGVNPNGFNVPEVSLEFNGTTTVDTVNKKSITATTPNASKVVASSSSRNSFLQIVRRTDANGLTPPPTRERNVWIDHASNVPISWPGGSSASDFIQVDHGLGVVPMLYGAHLHDQSGVGIAYISSVAANAAVCQFRAQTNGFIPGIGFNGSFSWFAIGLRAFT